MEVRKKRKKHVKYNGRLSLLPPSFGEEKYMEAAGRRRRCHHLQWLFTYFALSKKVLIWLSSLAREWQKVNRKRKRYYFPPKKKTDL